MIAIADRSMWSDEVEMLAKLRADLAMYNLRRFVKWEKYLPERFLDVALSPEVPTGQALKDLTRSLSSMLDGFIPVVNSWKNNGQ